MLFFSANPSLYSSMSATSRRACGLEFEASLDGSLIVSRRTGGDDNLLTWFNRKGEATGTVGGPDSYISRESRQMAPSSPSIAPTRRMATVISGTTEISRGITARLTTDAANDWFPAGRRIANRWCSRRIALEPNPAPADTSSSRSRWTLGGTSSRDGPRARAVPMTGRGMASGSRSADRYLDRVGVGRPQAVRVSGDVVPRRRRPFLSRWQVDRLHLR